MFLKLTTIITSLLFFVSVSLAETTTSTSGKFTLLEKGDTAPFKGTLFDPVATAKIIADKKYAKKECDLFIKQQSDLLNAKCIRDTNILKYELEIEKKKHKLIYDAQKEGSNNTLWAAIGFMLGAGASIAIFYAATEIAE